MEAIRFWEADRPLVVVGRSSKLGEEVREDVCRELSIPVLRRISGGAAVVAGPGCLMYSVVLSLRRRPSLATSAASIASCWKRSPRRCGRWSRSIGVRGASDLVLGDRKVSGNSMRMRQGRLLYHGTLLYDFPLELIARALAMPPRQPEYRRGRPHGGLCGQFAPFRRVDSPRRGGGLGGRGAIRRLAAGADRATGRGEILPPRVELPAVVAIWSGFDDEMAPIPPLTAGRQEWLLTGWKDSAIL